ncbi:predicted protein [Chaetoceros tenuissimus]|uniref:Uncharacterized protein n=1 Tax=Chaetoceros tenuissimus TaxID=426638 RepID=A0AAD3HE77_9STRA|nr:predicted protein [Chaetoceros tenuissimus]
MPSPPVEAYLQLIFASVALIVTLASAFSTLREKDIGEDGRIVSKQAFRRHLFSINICDAIYTTGIMLAPFLFPRNGLSYSFIEDDEVRTVNFQGTSWTVGSERTLSAVTFLVTYGSLASKAHLAVLCFYYFCKNKIKLPTSINISFTRSMEAITFASIHIFCIVICALGIKMRTLGNPGLYPSSIVWESMPFSYSTGETQGLNTTSSLNGTDVSIHVPSEIRKEAFQINASRNSTNVMNLACLSFVAVCIIVTCITMIGMWTQMSRANGVNERNSESMRPVRPQLSSLRQARSQVSSQGPTGIQLPDSDATAPRSTVLSTALSSAHQSSVIDYTALLTRQTIISALTTQAALYMICVVFANPILITWISSFFLDPTLNFKSGSFMSILVSIIFPLTGLINALVIHRPATFFLRLKCPSMSWCTSLILVIREGGRVPDIATSMNNNISSRKSLNSVPFGVEAHVSDGSLKYKDPSSASSLDVLPFEGSEVEHLDVDMDDFAEEQNASSLDSWKQGLVYYPPFSGSEKDDDSDEECGYPNDSTQCIHMHRYRSSQLSTIEE